MIVKLKFNSQCKNFNDRALSKKHAKCRFEYIFTRFSFQYFIAIRSSDDFIYF